MRLSQRTTRFVVGGALLLGVGWGLFALAPLPQDPKSPAKQTAAKPTNHLAGSTSPYLLQHAHNPVDWYPWGKEALEKAKKENKPIFLSIGYAACHWCHVMEHESFEHPEVAAILNQHFVSIKVDREERPDIDEIYMQYTVEVTGSGGWPMSVFLTPELKPFYAGTYYPREHFIKVLNAVSEAWHKQPAKVAASANGSSDSLKQWARGLKPAPAPIPAARVGETANLLAGAFDSRRGGLSSGGNKFPPSMAMELMLREYRRTGSKRLLELVEVTLDQMARGGIYDQLGGGIHRYSTDPDWLVPHFEKMLYDQALVSSIYLDAYQVTHKPLYARMAREILDYVLQDLQSPEGGFYSTRDADSEGREGKYYVWTRQEIAQIIGRDEAAAFSAYYGVSSKGNWRDPTGHAPPGPQNILHVPRATGVVAKELGLSEETLEQKLQAARPKLLAVRARRVPPGLDDKILTDWNGLMIASLAKGARVLDEPQYAQAAARAGDFVLTNLCRDGRLLHTYREGKSHLNAYLSDYAFLIEGLVNLYEATFDSRWLREAKELTDVTIHHYFDPQDGGFFFTADDHEELIARLKSQHDGAIPAGNSVHAMNLLRLAVLFDSKDYRSKAESIFRVYEPVVRQSPGAVERLLSAVDFYANPPKEIALAGPADRAGLPDPDLEQLVQAIYEDYIPNKVVAYAADGDSEGARLEKELPLLASKRMLGGKPTVYVCQNYSCKRPVTTAKDLKLLLRQ